MSVSVTITSDIWAIPNLSLTERTVLAAYRQYGSVSFNQTTFSELTGIPLRSISSAVRILNIGGFLDTHGQREITQPLRETTQPLRSEQPPSPPLLLSPPDGSPCTPSFTPPIILPTPSPEKPLPGAPAVREDLSAGFAEFWEAWPRTDRKEKKKDCLKKWRCKFLCRVAPVIMADVAARKNSRKWLDGFEPAPLTYLNGELWDDGEVINDRPEPADDDDGGLFNYPSVDEALGDMD